MKSYRVLEHLPNGIWQEQGRFHGPRAMARALRLTEGLRAEGRTARTTEYEERDLTVPDRLVIGGAVTRAELRAILDLATHALEVEMDAGSIDPAEARGLREAIAELGQVGGLRD